MPHETLIALFSFAVVTAFTPGPNNIMLTASGVNFGYRRTLAHIAGIWVGFVSLLLAAGFGVGALLTAVPAAQWLLKIGGGLYLLWLAWRVANAGAAGPGDGARPRPLRFIEAAAFQWVNPKGLVMAISAMSVYVRPGHAMADVFTVTGAFAAVSPFAASTWALFGAALRTVLHDPARVRVFNIVMAVLLVATIVPLVFAGEMP